MTFAKNSLKSVTISENKNEWTNDVAGTFPGGQKAVNDAVVDFIRNHKP